MIIRNIDRVFKMKKNIYESGQQNRTKIKFIRCLMHTHHSKKLFNGKYENLHVRAFHSFHTKYTNTQIHTIFTLRNKD